MRIPITVAAMFAAILASGMAHAAATVEITSATISGAKLTVKGTSPSASQTVKLDGQFTVKSDAQKNFVFVLTDYHPADCVVTATVGSKQATGVVSNCGQTGKAADATVTVNLLGLSGRSCSTFDVAVPGVAAGDVVMVSVVGTMNILNNEIMTAERATAADTVRVKYCNPTDTGGVQLNGIQLRFIALR